MKNLEKYLSTPLPVLSFWLIITLTGCSTRWHVKHPVLSNGRNIPTLVPIYPPLIRWRVITPEVTERWNIGIRGNAEVRKQAQIRDQGQGEEVQGAYVYVGLSHRDYLAFTAWLNEVVVYLKSLKAVQKKLDT